MHYLSLNHYKSVKKLWLPISSLFAASLWLEAWSSHRSAWESWDVVLWASEEPDDCWIIEYSGESTVSKLEQIEWVNKLDEDENFPIIGSLKMTFSLLIQDYAE